MRWISGISAVWICLASAVASLNVFLNVLVTDAHAAMVPASIKTSAAPLSKWAQIARDATKKHYPGSSIVDFEHVGRVEQANGITAETFQAWVVHNHQEVGLFVSVSFVEKTNQLIEVRFKPTRS